jgi:hypothetical protein
MSHVRNGSAIALAIAMLVGCGGGSTPSTIMPQAQPAAGGNTTSPQTNPGRNQHGGGSQRHGACAKEKKHGKGKKSACTIVHATFDLYPHKPGPRHHRGVHPHFVASSTNGMTWVAYVHNTSTIDNQGVDDLSSSSALCTQTAPRTCNIPFQVDGTPGGAQYDVTMTMYDQAPVSGVIPVGANALGIANTTITVFSNQANNFSFLVDGIWKTSNYVVSGSSVTYESMPSDNNPHTLNPTVQALDADGNIITGPNPYYSPLPVAIVETGGSGHATVSVNGGTGAASVNLTKPADTLTVNYDGKGAVGYTTVTTAGSSAALRVSPMYLTPTAAASLLVLSGAPTSTAIKEQSAPAGIAYNAVVGTCPNSTITPNVTGSGAAATAAFTATTNAGTAQTCNVTISDILGTSMTYPIPESVSGPISVTAQSFPTGGSGTCAASYAFTGAGQTASLTVTDPLYVGTITAQSSATGVMTAVRTGSNTPETVTLTAVAAGTATLTLTDTSGNTKTCSIGVTTSGGGVSFVPQPQLPYFITST